MTMNLIDRVGTWASSLCALHCCAMPFLIGVLPILGVSFLATNEFEWTMIAIAGVLGGYGAYAGFRFHQRLAAIALFTIGILTLISNRIVIAATTTEACCVLHAAPEEGLPFQVFPAVVGGLLVASSHVVNHHLCKNCKECTSDSCDNDHSVG